MTVPLKITAGGIVQFNASDILPVVNGGTGAGTLTGYVKAAGTAAFIALATIPFSDVSARPTTVAGYGITDALTPASWASPGAIGATTPNTAVVTSLTASTGSAAVAGAFSASGSGSGGTISLIDAGAGGANIKFVGNGATTPNKSIRVNSGNMEWVNSAYNAVIATLTDTGALNVVGAFTANAASVITTSGSIAAFILTDTGANGANFRLAGNGATTPNKTLRAIAGNLEFINSAYSAVIATLTDAGSFTAAGFNGTLGATTPNSVVATTISGNNSLLINTSAANTTHQFINTSSNGVQIAMYGNGATTPSKTLRVLGGILDIVNSAYTVTIFALTDAGNLTTFGHTLNGNVSAASWLTAGVGFQATGSTYTNNSTASSTTVATAHIHTFAAPTLAATNTLVTTASSATVFIAGAPIAGTNQTITNSWALLIGSGQLGLPDGTAANPSITFAANKNVGFFNAGGGYMVFSSLGAAVFSASPTGMDVATGLSYSINDTFFTRDSIGVWAMRNGATAHGLRLYQTYTDASNYSRLAFNTAAGRLTIAAESAGTGTANVDLEFNALGTGRLRTNSILANGAVATVLGSLGPTGANTTVQEWIAIKNAAGTVRYIPAF